MTSMVGLHTTITYSLDKLQRHKYGKVSIILPAYNLENVICDSILSLKNELQKLKTDYEIIVVDDGSTDNTYKKVLELNDSHVKIIRNHRNIGKGYAVKRGILASTGDYIIFVDADMDIGYKDIGRYIIMLKRFDIVIGSKRHPDSTYIAPAMRKILSLAFNLIVRLLTGINVSDTQTGFKAFRGEIGRHIMRLVLVKRYAFDVEMLAVARLLNAKIYEVPVKIIQESRFSLKSILYMIVDLMGIVYRLRFKKWYQKNIRNLTPKYNPILKL